MSEHEQLSFSTGNEASDDPVVCLGLTFKNDDERREYFREELRKKLPELKQIEGFPIGEDEDIIALSDPPYYTACPNPWTNVFIKEWNKSSGKELDQGIYKREPYAMDVSVGKNDPIYNAHSYHTKVPYKAIMNYILHYTSPGDIILDGFSGTGMTGVAASMCGDHNALQSIGFQVENNKVINKENGMKSKIGSRKSILSDLSPAASFIAYNYNIPINVENFILEARKIMEEIKNDYSWIYKTNHKQTNFKGTINYVVWSDVFICPHCMNELVFYEVALDDQKKKVKDSFACSHCKVNLTKKGLTRAFSITYDNILKQYINQAKKIPVLINYTYENKRYEKKLDSDDLHLIEKMNNYEFDSFIPTLRMPEGDESRRNDKIGITHVHHFYTKRNLFVLSKLLKRIEDSKFHLSLLLIFQSIVMTLSSQLVRYNMGNRGNGPLSGTLYLSSLNAESNIFNAYEGKVKDFSKALKILQKNKNSVVSTQSLTNLNLKENSIDYIFTDPPFGANIMYSELNFIWESWLKVGSNNFSEAIVNKTQNKGFEEYQRLMESCFEVYYRALKPGKWITIEFSNSKASVWNAIQEAIERAGFIIANVSALDKKQGSFKAVTTTIAVKQDLVISAYKPTKENIEKMKKEINTVESAWTFIHQHLEQLAVFQGTKGEVQIISERTPRILFDRMVAYHVKNGLTVPISSPDFQAEIAQRFLVRDGMIFLENQVIEYDKMRALNKELSQLSLFVSDENSAIEWIRHQLLRQPQTRQSLHPQFMKEIQYISKHEKLPELDDLLIQNFLRYDNEPEVSTQIVSYFRRNYPDLRGLEPTDEKLKQKAINRWYVPDPNKQADLEKLREKSLLREFNLYVDEMTKSKKKLKEFRTEAIRAGFKKAWSEKDYQTILDVGNRLPESVIQEDDKLLMYFDNAQIKLGL